MRFITGRFESGAYGMCSRGRRPYGPPAPRVSWLLFTCRHVILSEALPGPPPSHGEVHHVQGAQCRVYWYESAHMRRGCGVRSSTGGLPCGLRTRFTY